MKTHATNYKNTFIEVAEDCPVKAAEIPPIKAAGKKHGEYSIRNGERQSLQVHLG